MSGDPQLDPYKQQFATGPHERRERYLQRAARLEALGAGNDTLERFNQTEEAIELLIQENNNPLEILNRNDDNNLEQIIQNENPDHDQDFENQFLL